MARCGPTLQDWRTCGNCSECLIRKRSDLVGRCLAELSNPEVCQSFAVDLTYRDVDGESPMGALVLMYKHFDTLVTKMRDAAWSPNAPKGHGKRGVRFLVAGEYGSLKGRAHWHAVFFITGEALSLPPFGTRAEWDMWPYGHAWLKPADHKTIAYAVKYALKPSEDEASFGYVKKPNYSRYPPLGDWYFRDLAERHVEGRFAVHGGQYRFSDVPTSSINPTPRVFYMRHVTLRNFLAHYVERWRVVWGGLPPLTEFLMEHHFDSQAADEVRADAADFEAHLAAVRRRDPLVSRSSGVRFPSREVPGFQRKRIGTFLLPRGGVVVVYSDANASVGFGDAECAVFDARDPWAFGSAVAVRFGLTEVQALELSWWVSHNMVSRFDPVGSAYPVMSLAL